MMYANSGIRAFIPPGGVCEGHFKPEDMKSVHPITGKVHLSIQCEHCEPFLLGDPMWANTLEDVALTAEEQKSIDVEEAKANKGMAAFSQEFMSGYMEYLKTQQGKK
jgi:hypothetical protein